MLELRCSSLPLAFKCGGSVRAEGLRVTEDSGASALGTAAHEGLAQMVMGTGEPPEVIAKRYGVDVDELGMLLAMGRKMWGLIAHEHLNQRTEHEESASFPDHGFVLTGHIDLLGHKMATESAGYVRTVTDWKTGHADADYREQLLGYAALVLAWDLEGADAVDAGAAWVRTGEYEPHRMRRSELDAWAARVQREIVNWNGVYRAGDHCTFCPRKATCPAREALARSQVTALLADGDLSQAIAEMAPEQVVSLVERARSVMALASGFIDAAREHVRAHGDVVAGGKRLTLEVQNRRQVDPLKAFPVLTDGWLDDTEMAQVVEVSLSKAEKLVAQRAGRGKGAGEVRKLQASLDAAGAVSVVPTTKLTVRRAT